MLVFRPLAGRGGMGHALGLPGRDLVAWRPAGARRPVFPVGRGLRADPWFENWIVDASGHGPPPFPLRGCVVAWLVARCDFS